MQRTVYYLTHLTTERRLQWYKTLQGARIAQRSRNSRLGFYTRCERVEIKDGWEAELCVDHKGNLTTATWCIVEDTIDSEIDQLTLADPRESPAEQRSS
jgi:hypothetical protein